MPRKKNEVLIKWMDRSYKGEQNNQHCCFENLNLHLRGNSWNMMSIQESDNVNLTAEAHSVETA